VSDETAQHSRDFSHFFNHGIRIGKWFGLQLSADFAMNHQLSAKFTTRAFAVAKKPYEIRIGSPLRSFCDI